MDTNFEAILNNLPNKAPRSHLEPYTELITEMRKRGRSYREIAQVLKKVCGLKVGASTVNDFVLARTQSRTKSPVPVSMAIRTRTKKNANELTGTYKNVEDHQGIIRPRRVLEDIARTIKELKVRPSKTTAKKLLFEYNPDEPLRLQHNKRTKE